MKILILSIFIFGSLSSYAIDCSEKAIKAVETKVLSGATNCDTSTAGDFKIEQVILPVTVQATLFEVSYYCEAGAGAIVVFDDECSGEGRIIFTDNWE